VGEQFRSQIHELFVPAAHASNLQPSTSNTHKRTSPQSITHVFPVGRLKTASLLKQKLDSAPSDGGVHPPLAVAASCKQEPVTAARGLAAVPWKRSRTLAKSPAREIKHLETPSPRDWRRKPRSRKMRPDRRENERKNATGGTQPLPGGGGAVPGGARTREPWRASRENTWKTGGAKGMKRHDESGGAIGEEPRPSER
jgi:hypothetical protein